jgi:hypothetical protein
MMAMISGTITRVDKPGRETDLGETR